MSFKERNLQKNQKVFEMIQLALRLNFILTVTSYLAGKTEQM